MPPSRSRERFPVSPKRALGQHFLVDENILGVIGRLAALERDDVVLEIGPGLGVLTRYLAERVALVHAVELDRALEPPLRERLGDATTSSSSSATRSASTSPRSSRRRTKLVANLPYNVATPIVVESLDGLPTRRALVRDGAAGGRRPLLRRAQHEGVRRRLRARPARRPSGRASTRSRATVSAHRPNVDSALVAFRRRDRRPARLRAAQAARRGSVRPPAEDAPELARARRARVPRAGRRRRSTPSACPPATRAEALAPGEFVALAHALAVRRDPGPGEAQPRARRRAGGAPTAARGDDRAPAPRPRRPDRARAGRRLSRRRLPRRHARPRTRSSALAARGGRRAALGARSPSGSRSPPGSAAAARTRPPRCCLRTRRCPSRSTAAALHALAAGLGADVPFFLSAGPAARRPATARSFAAARAAAGLLGRARPAARGGEAFHRRRLSSLRRARRRAGLRGAPAPPLLEALAQVRRPRDLAALPPNDLASLAARGRAARSGRLPGRRHRRRAGRLRPVHAARRERIEPRPGSRPLGATWVTVPAWYG